jgi:uncharacterized membrane protein YfcA
MTDLTILMPLISLAFLMVAFFYASVGLGGGSTYTAMLALCGIGAAAIPIVTLSLNLVVTTLGFFMFFKEKHSRIRLILPFLVASIPMAYLGGALHVSKGIFYFLLFFSLIFAAWRIYLPRETKPVVLSSFERILLCVLAGMVLGLIAGITGIGGGVYLVPLIILFGLGSAKEAAACGSVFIWVNSVSGLYARLQYNSIDLMPYLPLFGAVFIGGLAGAYMGSTRFVPLKMQKILGSILVVAVIFLGLKIARIYS